MNQFVQEIKEALEDTGIELDDLGDETIGAGFKGSGDEPLYFKFIDHEDNTCSLLFFKNIDLSNYERIDLLEAINKLNRETCILGTTVYLFESEGSEPDVRVVSSETFAYGATKRILEAYSNISTVAQEIDRIF